MNCDYRKQLIATIYENGIAFIEEKRQIPAMNSRLKIELKDISPEIIMDTLFVKDAVIHSQQISRSVKSELDLLNQFIGQEIMFQEKGQLVKHKVRVISTKSNVVLQLVDTNQFLFNPNGHYIFANDVFNLFRDIVSLDLTANNDFITIYYGTRGFSWRMNYTLIVNRGTCRLKADCIIHNISGMDLEEVQIHLMAGGIKTREHGRINDNRIYGEHIGGGEIETFNLGGQHLLVLPEKTSLKSGEEIAINYFDKNNISIEKIYKFHSNFTKCTMNYHFENSKENGLNQILPSGRVRILEEKEFLTFVGEARVIKTNPKHFVMLEASVTMDFSIRSEKEILAKHSEEYHHLQTTYIVSNETANEGKVQVTHRFNHEVWEMLEFNFDPIAIDGKDITFELKVAPHSSEKLVIEYMEYL